MACLTRLSNYLDLVNKQNFISMVRKYTVFSRIYRVVIIYIHLYTCIYIYIYICTYTTE
jgi:hypothetical protein